MISIKTIMESWIDNQPKKVITKISPSQLGGCMRAHFLKIQGVEMTTPPETNELLNFQMGFVWEDVIEKGLKWAKEQGRIKDYESQVYFKSDKYNMEGTIDYLILDNDNNWTLWDSKTMRSEWFWYLEKTNKKFLEDNSSYEFQLLAYLLLANENGLTSKSGALTFISKNDSMFGKEAVVEFTKENERRVVERIEKFQQYLDKNELPPCECEGWKIGYCDYGDVATREPNKKKKIVNTKCCMEELWRK